MIMTVEISMYPFNAEYKAPIKAFIERLQTCAGLRVQPGATSTFVVGEYGAVMSALGELFAWSHDTHGKAVFVTKFIPGYEPD